MIALALPMKELIVPVSYLGCFKVDTKQWNMICLANSHAPHCATDVNSILQITIPYETSVLFAGTSRPSPMGQWRWREQPPETNERSSHAHGGKKCWPSSTPHKTSPAPSFSTEEKTEEIMPAQAAQPCSALLFSTLLTFSMAADTALVFARTHEAKIWFVKHVRCRAAQDTKNRLYRLSGHPQDVTSCNLNSMQDTPGRFRSNKLKLQAIDSSTQALVPVI